MYNFNTNILRKFCSFYEILMVYKSSDNSYVFL